MRQYKECDQELCIFSNYFGAKLETKPIGGFGLLSPKEVFEMKWDGVIGEAVQRSLQAGL